MISNPEAGGKRPAWRLAGRQDLAAIMAIQSRVHTLLPEREAVFAAKIRLFGEGCLVLVGDGALVGYGVAHPWMLDDVPPLDAILGSLPGAPDCLFVHDVAILPEGRALGAGRAFIDRSMLIAQARGWPALALVSVYGTSTLWARCGFALRPLRPDKLTGYGETACYMTRAVETT